MPLSANVRERKGESSPTTKRRSCSPPACCTGCRSVSIRWEKACRLSSSPITSRRSAGNIIAAASGTLRRCSPRTMAATITPSLWLKPSSPNRFPAQSEPSGTSSEAMWILRLSSRPAKPGDEPCAERAITSRERRFCRNVRSILMLSHFTRREATIRPTMASAAATCHHQRKGDRKLST